MSPFVAVHAVIDGNIPNIAFSQDALGMVANFQIVPAHAGHNLDNDGFDFPVSASRIISSQPGRSKVTPETPSSMKNVGLGKSRQSKHSKRGHTSAKSPFPACCRGGDFCLLGSSQPLFCFANSTLERAETARKMKTLHGVFFTFFFLYRFSIRTIIPLSETQTQIT